MLSKGMSSVILILAGNNMLKMSLTYMYGAKQGFIYSLFALAVQACLLVIIILVQVIRDGSTK